MRDDAAVNLLQGITAFFFFDKIPLYNGVNLIKGLDSISINTPAEVIAYET